MNLENNILNPLYGFYMLFLASALCVTIAICLVFFAYKSVRGGKGFKVVFWLSMASMIFLFLGVFLIAATMFKMY